MRLLSVRNLFLVVPVTTSPVFINGAARRDERSGGGPSDMPGGTIGRKGGG